MKKIIALLLSMMMVLSMAACGSSGASSAASQSAPASTAASTGEADGSEATTAAIPGLEDGVFTVAMECAYAPYNWTQTDDSNGAVPIKDSNEYANGYDIMIPRRSARPTAGSWRSSVPTGIPWCPPYRPVPSTLPLPVSP